jgi:hypothetical protein
MEIMFHMMNEVRLEVGTQGFCHATTAYLHALNYARERLQGRDLEAGKDVQAPQVPIIGHPDVRRMLLWMKAHVDGMRSLTYYVAYLFDRLHTAPTAGQRQHLENRIGLMTPVVKAYCAERGFDVCVQAMQVFGGYGYTREYPVEQIVRDCKIASIYEGTDGIQALDLLGRKLGMQKGAVFADLIEDIGRAAYTAMAIDGLEEMAQRVARAAKMMAATADGLGRKIASERFKAAFVFALPFLEVMGDVFMAWMLLWRATIAAPKAAASAFYQGQIQTARFFIRTVLPITMGKMEAIQLADETAVTIDDKGFGG